MKTESKQKVSVVIPVYNEIKNVEKLLIRLSDTLTEAEHPFELIFVDDHSTDGTYEYLQRFTSGDTVIVHRKIGQRGKAYSLIEGFALATGSILVMIDADLQYPIEAIPSMLQELAKHDVVVSNRKRYQDSFARKVFSKTFRFWFGKLLFGLNHDIQSGLKVFKKEVFDTVSFTPKSGWTFDLEFLHRAKEAGYSIRNYDITFHPRKNGTSNVSFIKTTWEIGMNALQVRLQAIPPMTIKPTQKNSMIGAGIAHKKKKYITHSLLPHHYSALYTLNTWQKLLFTSIFLVLCAGVIMKPVTTGLFVTAILSFIYFVDVLFNLYLVLKSLYLPQEIRVEEKELANLHDTVLPVYTILCPLYKEAHVIPQFLASLRKIDWPQNKLDVILLIEEDDLATITALKHMVLPSYVRVAVVPDSAPKTKPKACNYGLSIALGEYLVIYDAEDVPDPLQLKKAYITFQKVPSNVRCLQAKLNYYNPHQNLLTRFFTAEYSLWFDVTLTGLQTLGTSIPLGGTSNHFKTQDLRKLHGWDPFNVTEDADLGIRLFKRGYKTAIIDSTTLEEANSNFKNWIRQRSRWLKGYMQTYLVHGRQNISFARQHGVHALIFQLIIGGKIAFILINPFLWVATISYFALYALVGRTIEQLYPRYVFYMAVVSLIFGNFLFLYYYMIGAIKRGHYTLVKYVYLVPLYWLMISTAGFVAFFQLLFKPHYWEKTVHGLHLKKEATRIIPKIIIATEEKENITTFPGSIRERISAQIVLNKHLFGGAFLVVASMIGNLGNLFFSTYFGRVLEPSVLGILVLVGSFWSISSIFLGGLGSTINYRTGFLDGRYGAETAVAFRHYIRRKTFAIAIAVSLLWLVASPFLVGYFQAENIYPFLAFFPIWLVGFAYFVDHGYLSGRLQFGSLGLIVVVEIVTKIVLGLFIEALNPSYVYLAFPLSFLFSFFFGWGLIRWGSRKIKPKHAVESKAFPKKFFVVSLLTGLSTITFLTLDFILAKHYLSPVEAGQYALLATVGKMIFFLGSLGNQFILPIISHEEGAMRNSRKTFYMVLTATYILSLSGFIAFSVFGEQLLTQQFLFGDKILPVLPYLVPFGIAMLCFTLSRSFVSYYMAKKMYAFPLVVSVLSLLQFVLITLSHNSIAAIVAAMVIVGGANLVLMIAMHLFEHPIRVIESNLIDFFGLFAKEEKESTKNGMRILVFNWRDTKHVWAGGAEVYIHELAKRWVKDGNMVTMFCGNDTKNARAETVDGVHVVRRGGFYTVYLWALLYYILRFAGKYDVIVDCENGIPFFTPLYTKTPVVLLIHHIHQDVFRKHLHFPLSSIARFAEAKMMPMVYKNSAVVTVSESSQTAIAKMGLARGSDIHIVHNGVDHNDFRKRGKQAYPLFSYVGRLKPYKNIDTAIKAFAKVTAQYPFAKLIIVGEGEAYPMLSSLVEDLKLANSVHFTGRVSDKAKARILGMSWAMLQPSMVEGWGITVIEANASGTPVIASDVSGLKDAIVDKKTGLLVQLGSSDAFANAIISIIENTKLRQYFAKEAYLWSKSFDWNESAEKFWEILKSQQKRDYNTARIRSVIATSK